MYCSIPAHPALITWSLPICLSPFVPSSKTQQSPLPLYPGRQRCPCVRTDTHKRVRACAHMYVRAYVRIFVHACACALYITMILVKPMTSSCHHHVNGHFVCARARVCKYVWMPMPKSMVIPTPIPHPPKTYPMQSSMAAHTSHAFPHAPVSHGTLHSV